MNKKQYLALTLGAAIIFGSSGCQDNSQIRTDAVQTAETAAQTGLASETPDMTETAIQTEPASEVSGTTETPAQTEPASERPLNSDIYALSDSEYSGISYTEFSDKYYSIETEGNSFCLADLTYSENLRELTIRDLGADNLKGIENFPNLEYLQINNDSMRDISALSECKSLKTLVVRFTETIEDFSVLSELENLTKLTVMLCENGSTAPNIECAGECKNLEILYLQGFTIEDVEFVGKLDKLRELRLWSYKTPVKDISPVTGLCGLEKLEITYGYKTDEGNIFENMTSLKELAIVTGYPHEENREIAAVLAEMLPWCEVSAAAAV